MKRIKWITADEYDVFTRWRKYYGWTKRPGATSAVKRRYRRRERATAKRELHDQASKEANHGNP